MIKSPNLSPTYAEMAARHRCAARSLRFQAARFGGDTPRGRLALSDAADHTRIAAGLEEKQAEALAARDGMLTEYRKARTAVAPAVTLEELSICV